MERDRFIVLPYSLHGKHIPNFMGRMVLDPLDPLRRFVPENYRERGPDKLCEGILGDPITYGSRADVIRNASSQELGLILTLYFQLVGRQEKSQSVSINGDLVQRYQMEQNLLRFRKLLADKQFGDEVTELLGESKDKPLYFVVGFLTTKGTHWELEGSKSRLAEARVQAKAGLAAGVAPDLDVAAQAKIDASQSTTTSANVEQEEIFAVAYDIVKPPKAPRKLWGRPKPALAVPVLAGQFRAGSEHLALGDEDSDEEMEASEEEVSGQGLVLSSEVGDIGGPNAEFVALQ